MRVNLSDGSWFPIPGYEGVYFIHKSGLVCNINGHIIKTINSKDGPRVELRKDGQRERLLIVDLLVSIGGSNETSGCV